MWVCGWVGATLLRLFAHRAAHAVPDAMGVLAETEAHATRGTPSGCELFEGARCVCKRGVCVCVCSCVCCRYLRVYFGGRHTQCAQPHAHMHTHTPRHKAHPLEARAPHYPETRKSHHFPPYLTKVSTLAPLPTVLLCSVGGALHEAGRQHSVAHLEPLASLHTRGAALRRKSFVCLR